MISGKHDKQTICNWFSDFVDVKPPQEVVILYESAALLLASIKASTQFNNVAGHLNNCCHKLLEGCNITKLLVL